MMILYILNIAAYLPDYTEDVLSEFIGEEIKIFFSAYSHYHVAEKVDKDDEPFIAVSKFRNAKENKFDDRARINTNDKKYEITIGDSKLCYHNKELRRCRDEDDITLWDIDPAIFGFQIMTSKKCLTKGNNEPLKMKGCSGSDEQIFDFKRFVGIDKCDEANIKKNEIEGDEKKRAKRKLQEDKEDLKESTEPPKKKPLKSAEESIEKKVEPVSQAAAPITTEEKLKTPGENQPIIPTITKPVEQQPSALPQAQPLVAPQPQPQTQPTTQPVVEQQVQTQIKPITQEKPAVKTETQQPAQPAPTAQPSIEEKKPELPTEQVQYVPVVHVNPYGFAWSGADAKPQKPELETLSDLVQKTTDVIKNEEKTDKGPEISQTGEQAVKGPEKANVQETAKVQENIANAPEVEKTGESTVKKEKGNPKVNNFNEFLRNQRVNK